MRFLDFCSLLWNLIGITLLLLNLLIECGKGGRYLDAHQGKMRKPTCDSETVLLAHHWSRWVSLLLMCSLLRSTQRGLLMSSGGPWNMGFTERYPKEPTEGLHKN